MWTRSSRRSQRWKLPTSSDRALPHLLVRADCSTEIGVGHMMRCFALSQAWQQQGGEAEFLSVCGSRALRESIVAKGVGFADLADPHPNPTDRWSTMNRLNQLSSQESQQPWLVLDGYHFDPTYQRALRSTGCRVLVIDDQANLPFYHADVLLNQNAGADQFTYRCEPNTDLLLGTRFALLRPEFRDWRSTGRRMPVVARKLLVTLGGGDPDNVTGRIVDVLGGLHVGGLQIRVVVGPTNPHAAALEGRGDNVRLIRDPQNMPELLVWADLTVSGAGSTCWEIACLGVPAIVITLAENQREIAVGLAELGAAVSIGSFDDRGSAKWAEDVTTVINNQSLRQRMADVGRQLVDGSGARRVVDHLRKTAEG